MFSCPLRGSSTSRRDRHEKKKLLYSLIMTKQKDMKKGEVVTLLGEEVVVREEEHRGSDVKLEKVTLK